jgi:hypothetical protein
MTLSAPAAKALVMSPLYLMPPSAMIGQWYSLLALAASRIALIWGTPMPEMMRVVQIEPGPMPTLTAIGTGLHQIAWHLHKSRRCRR